MNEINEPDNECAAPLLNQGEADLVVSLGDFDGPIDLLLNLAREQKLDLASISILDLAEQYIAFISTARKLKLEVAADYLVMAAWLAYLKSRLLLPDPPKDEPDATDMAEALKFQLLRLESMQKASQALQDLPLLGHDIFLRGEPEERTIQFKPVYYMTLYDLLSSLAAPARRQKKQTAYTPPPMRLYTLEDGLKRLRRTLGLSPSWASLESFLPPNPAEQTEDAMEARSMLASTFAATLELVKAGELEIRQDGTFAPLYMRRRKEEKNQDPPKELTSDQHEQ